VAHAKRVKAMAEQRIVYVFARAEESGLFPQAPRTTAHELVLLRKSFITVVNGRRYTINFQAQERFIGNSATRKKPPLGLGAWALFDSGLCGSSSPPLRDHHGQRPRCLSGSSMMKRNSLLGRSSNVAAAMQPLTLHLQH
jgi:hypothetical protein